MGALQSLFQRYTHCLTRAPYRTQILTVGIRNLSDTDTDTSLHTHSNTHRPPTSRAHSGLPVTSSPSKSAPATQNHRGWT